MYMYNCPYLNNMSKMTKITVFDLNMLELGNLKGLCYIFESKH